MDTTPDIHPGHTPPTTPDAQQSKLIALAYKQVEKQLQNGTASSQTIAHFLKQDSRREELELAKMQKEILMLQSKIDSADTAADLVAMFDEVKAAQLSYAPYSDYDEVYR